MRYYVIETEDRNVEHSAMGQLYASFEQSLHIQKYINTQKFSRLTHWELVLCFYFLSFPFPFFSS